MTPARFVMSLLAPALLLGANCGPPQTPLFPQNYAATFVLVRACRPTVEHAGTSTSHIAVYVNPESASAYMNNANPLPPGTVVVKEEHDRADCSHIAAYSVVRKEEGFDPAHGDWHWQRLRADRSVEEDGQVRRCIQCHQPCRPRDWMCTEP